MLGNLLKSADADRNLDVLFDADLTFSKHVQVICKCCFGHVRDLRRLSNSLIQNALVTAYKLYKIVLLELSPRLPNKHTYLQFAKCFIGSLLNIVVLLVYKFLHSGTDYFTLYLKP